MPTLTTVTQNSFESPSQSNQGKKKKKRNPNWQRRNKTLSLFIDDMILNIENPKNTTRKLINEFTNRIQN